MKNIAKVCLLSMAVATIFAGCAKENFKSVKGEGMVFTATIGQLTRTSLDMNDSGAKVNWVAGDTIKINGITFEATPDASDPTYATFTKLRDTDADPEAVNGKYYAIYGCTFSASSESGTLPEAQDYSAEGANAPMYAESEDTVLEFNNICGVLEISLSGTDVVSKIKVSSDNLATSGKFTITDGQTAVLEDMGPDYKYDVNLDCGEDGVALTSAGTKFYVAIPAGDYEALNVKVISSDGKSWSKATTATASVEASKIYRLAFAPEFEDHFVAQIGSTGYNTLEEAFAAVGTDPVTITVLEDCISDKIETVAGQDITFDLNGKTVDTYFSNYGKLTIEDSSADKTGVLKTQRGYGQLFYERDGSELVINGGTLVGPTSDNAALKCQKNSLTTINGGIIRGTYAVYFSATTAKVVVDGGYLKGEEGVFDLYAAGALEVKDGFIDGEFICGNKKTANTVTTGGYYTVEPNFASTGYAPKQLSSPVTEQGVDFYYTIAEFNGMMSINGDVFEDVADAVDAINNATSDVTVQFLQNISLDQEIVINNANAKVTLDLNGKTVRAMDDGNASAVLVEGAGTVVDLIDSVGGGMLDHTYAGTAYTLTVKDATVNLISANVSNMTSTGYGRNAVRVLAVEGNSYFNMTGGVVRGGRGIRVGGTSETARAYATISGGFVEARNTTSGSNYPAVGTETGYSTILINGGTLTAGSASVVYSTSSNTNTSITITKNEVTGTIPFIYAGGKYCIGSGSSDYGTATYNVTAWNFYTNNSSTSYCGKPVPKKTPLETPITDEYGYTYTYHITPAD